MTKRTKRNIIVAIALIIIFIVSVSFLSYVQSPPNSNDENQTTISDEQAVEIVKNLPDVKAWLDVFDKIKASNLIVNSEPVIEVSNYEDGIYTVHVYRTTEGGGFSEFNTYEVNSETGEVY